MIVNTQTSLNTPVALAALVWISAVGLLLYGLVGAAVDGPGQDVQDRGAGQHVHGRAEESGLREVFTNGFLTKIEMPAAAGHKH